MKQLLPSMPILQTIKHYKKEWLVQDSIAAVIVTIMLIPQSLAYALLAGLPPEMGLYASILPLMLYAIFGSSHALSVGPVAVVSLMTATALSQASNLHGIDYLSGALTLALLSGVFMLLLGFLRFGFIANLLSHPVVSGFISASALMIALSQVKHILGINASGATLFEMLHSQAQQLTQIKWLTVVIGISVLAFLWWSRKHLKLLLQRIGLPNAWVFPLVKSSPVLAVIATVAASALFNLSDKGVAIIGQVPKGLPSFTSPLLDMNTIQALWLPAVLISIIGYVESVSVGKTLAARIRRRINPNQELVALGAANVGAAFSGGFPVTGGFSRSVVNFDAGAATQVASLLTAIGILLAALFLTPILYFLPKVTLAATIIIAVLSLVDQKPFIHAWQYSKTDFIAIASTFLLTLILGVEVGVLSGVVASITLHLIKTAKPHIAEVGLVPETEHFRNIHRHNVETSEQLLTLRPDESLYFINANALIDCIYHRVATRPELKHIIIQCTAINEIDLSALEALEALNEQLDDNGIKLHLSEVKGPVMDKLKRSGFLSQLSGRIFLTQFQAYKTLTKQNEHSSAP